MDTNPKTKYINWTDGTVECRECGELFDTAAAFDAHNAGGAATGPCLPTYKYPKTLHKTKQEHWSL